MSIACQTYQVSIVIIKHEVRSLLIFIAVHAIWYTSRISYNYYCSVLSPEPTSTVLLSCTIFLLFICFAIAFQHTKWMTSTLCFITAYYEFKQENCLGTDTCY